MALTKRTGNEKPRPLIGKTADKTRLVRFVDLNKTIDELEVELAERDEQISDLQTQIDELSAESPSQTETVTISSAEILAMGGTPIELLPAPGSNQYYDVEKVLYEYTFGTTNYTFGSYLTFIFEGDAGFSISSPFGVENRAQVFYQGGINVDVVEGVNLQQTVPLDSAFQLTTFDSSNPTLGDGTIRLIITYTTRTFGA